VTGAAMAEKRKKKKAEKAPEKKKEIHIPLIPIQDDSQIMEEEMKELFQEDQVTHKHGVTEPERD
jgi:hypothetical protein